MSDNTNQQPELVTDLELELGQSGYADGNAFAVFKGLELVPERPGKDKAGNEIMFKPGFKWRFEFTGGPNKGKQYTVSTTRNIDLEHNSGKIVAALNGGYKVGDKVNVKDLVGKKVNLTIMGGKFAGISPPPAE